LAKDRNSRSNKDSEVGSSELPPARQAPFNRIEKIATLLSELADLMRQEDLGKESIHHLRQLQMRIRFAQEQSPKTRRAQAAPPAEAPARWLQRNDRDESPIDFIRREYAAWLGSISRANLRSLDMSLYDALKHWLRNNQLPADIDLPTKREMIDREVADASPRPIRHTAEQREKLRLNQAARRRAAKADSRD
jgi:hypothetical protein